jgi:hypothetical protein
MSPEFQVLFDGAIALLVFFALRALNTQDESIKSVHRIANELIIKVQAMEVLVAGNYITRLEFNKHIDAMFKKLDDISEKLDSKQDKSSCFPIHNSQK